MWRLIIEFEGGHARISERYSLKRHAVIQLEYALEQRDEFVTYVSLHKESS